MSSLFCRILLAENEQGKEKRRQLGEISGNLFISEPFTYLGLRPCQESQYRSLQKNIRRSGTNDSNPDTKPVSSDRLKKKQVMTCSHEAIFANL